MSAGTMGQGDVSATVHKARSSFFWGMRLLPRARREAIFAVYAFCREVDDVADGDATVAEKRRQLASWRRAVEALYAGAPPEGPVMEALAEAVRRFELPRAEFLAILDGMESDATAALVGPEDAELRLYCRRVAGAVGVLALAIFAEDDPNLPRPRRIELAETLGEALQLTNILRDLRDDARRGRLYLPDARLAEAGLESRDPAEVVDDPRVAFVCRGLAAEAEAGFERARAQLRPAARATARPCRLMLEVYAALLRRIQAAGYPPPERRVRLTGLEKAGVVLRHALF